jgi:Ca2+-binding RTX toxin-like protein
MNHRGDAAVAWVHGLGLQASIRAAHAERWSAPAGVSDYWDGRRGRIALDEAGNATAVWAGYGRVSASFKPVGEAWQDDYLLSGYDNSTVHPAVVSETEQHATAVWVREGEADDRIEAVSYDVDTAKREADGGEDEEDVGDDEEGEVFSGTSGPDRLVGTPGSDIFYGFAGNDVIDGRGGRDVVYAGSGDDRVAGGGGRDRLLGGSGRDTIRGGRGSDVLVGGPAQDVLLGGSGNDAFRARDLRRDLVFGGVGLDAYRLDRWLDRARSIETHL